MAEFKLTINDPKTGRSYKKVLESDLFKNKKINQNIKGDDFGFKGYEFEITGGSDNAGFPMRKDLEGISKRKALLSKGVGMKKNKKGLRLRKTICGNSISNDISQINLKIKKYGAKKIDEILRVKKEEKVEEKKVEEKSKEEIKKEKEREIKKEKSGKEVSKEEEKVKDEVVKKEKNEIQN